MISMGFRSDSSVNNTHSHSTCRSTRKFGWETIDIGGVQGARLLEQLAFLWKMHYFRTG